MSDTGLSAELAHNVTALQKRLGESFDIVFHPAPIGGRTSAVLIYIKGLTDLDAVQQHVLKPLLQPEDGVPESVRARLTQIPVAEAKVLTTLEDCTEQVLSGNLVLMVDGYGEAWSFGLAKGERRGIEEPVAETVIRGPREGFTETLEVNSSLLRRKIKNHRLHMQQLQLGEQTRTPVVLVYMQGKADERLIREVQTRLQRIQLDSVLESSYIEELIVDHRYSPFPQLLSTERADVTAAYLLEGRVAIMTEGTPFVLIAPITLVSLLQAPDDYYQGYLLGTFIRIIRYLFFALSLFLPAVYVALLTFHQEMIPTILLLKIATLREEIPFPVIVEALMMELMFEALREAGLRLPKQIGSAVSIVGALVIGQAAVQAGLVSAPMVIIVALTGVASFMIPRYPLSITTRLIRIPLIVLAGTIGLLGVIYGLLAVLIHLCGLQSFGTPYLAPLSPASGKQLQDTVLRAPWWIWNRKSR